MPQNITSITIHPTKISSKIKKHITSITIHPTKISSKIKKHVKLKNH
jgi:hypothetical protein